MLGIPKMGDMHIQRLVIGDWSGDGHSQSDFYRFEANHDRKQIIEAYKQSAIKAGVSVCRFQGGPDDVLCEDYDDSQISRRSVEKLAAIGITEQDLLDTTHFERDDDDEHDVALSTWGEGLVYLFLMMVSKSLPEFSYKLLNDDHHDCINAFWQQDFNASIGYGLYH